MPQPDRAPILAAGRGRLVSPQWDGKPRNVTAPVEGGLLRAFKLEPIGGMKLRPIVWAIRDLMETDSLGMLFGDPGTFKSFLAVEIAVCVAAGIPFFGKPVDRCGPVVFIAGEGRNGLVRRFTGCALARGVDLATLPVVMSSTAAALIDPRSTIEVIAAIDDCIEQFGPPALVVIDTLARNFGPGNESATEDMNLFVASADMIRARYGCAVVVVHHTGHADKARARGAMVLHAAMDAEYRLDRDETGVIRMTCTKMKDAPEPEPMAFRPRAVDLGIVDDDGEPVTSAVLEPTEYQPAPASGKSARGKWQTVALEQLSVLERRHRENREAGGLDPDGARVMLDDWRRACTDAGMPRQRWGEVRDSLRDQGLVATDYGFVRRVLSGLSGSAGS